MKYETVIGLEVHAELSTKSKAFCGCPNEFGKPENTQCCPICTGMPGVLPVLNKKVVDYCIKAGLATNCKITPYGKQDRKNYFYADLPKAYQISQYDLPICKDGYVEIKVGDETKRIGITRIHIEEDAGKLMHDPHGGTRVDLNRCGVPLIEI
ncbi:MAG: Asp-tRNA(Asn)/Glu-tRNA(Gln) amidotransferase GatCAB subunit B, partial [Clostridiaceae bacterium]|nr:Asp-tRNA(Asn)/Glu-tRNA(Gln) amidotransferase GatCAB subunit B [Clostridiaceae bacterium]